MVRCLHDSLIWLLIVLVQLLVLMLHKLLCCWWRFFCSSGCIWNNAWATSAELMLIESVNQAALSLKSLPQYYLVFPSSVRILLIMVSCSSAAPIAVGIVRKSSIIVVTGNRMWCSKWWESDRKIDNLFGICGESTAAC